MAFPTWWLDSSRPRALGAVAIGYVGTPKHGRIFLVTGLALCHDSSDGFVRSDPSRDRKGAYSCCHDRISNVRFLTVAARYTRH